jgi:hypothetical protein
MIQAPGVLGNLQVFNASLTLVIKTEGLSMCSIVALFANIRRVDYQEETIQLMLCRGQ